MARDEAGCFGMDARVVFILYEHPFTNPPLVTWGHGGGRRPLAWLFVMRALGRWWARHLPTRDDGDENYDRPREPGSVIFSFVTMSPLQLMTLADAVVGLRRAAILALTSALAITALLGLANLPLHNGCKMTYMYPTYIPLQPPANLSTKYGLFLYHEGWQKIDVELHLLKLSGVPILFIPGNGGSYKQVRSLAAESERAFNGGPPEETFFREAMVTSQEFHQSGISASLLHEHTSSLQKSYANHLDWFAVDLDGEHSAMDGAILEEHTEYVVQAVEWILDKYQEAFLARSKSRDAIGEVLPTSVILVGHSMGGFVARAAVVHPLLRKASVQTVVTLSSPHQSPPIAFQPSLGRFFTRINSAWINGYALPHKSLMLPNSDTVPSLSDVVVVSIFGGTHDFQVRANLASLEGIVPLTNGLTLGAPEMLNVWLSMEHQCILWCNQLVVQVAHTLLHLIGSKSTQPVSSPQLRLAILTSKLLSALAQTFDTLLPGVSGIDSEVNLRHKLHRTENRLSDTLANSRKDYASRATDFVQESSFSCPQSVQWVVESQEKDLYVETPIVSVLAMDGRRRWLNIKEMVSSGRNSFVMVTNLAPCAGVRLHLWPEKDTLLSNREEAVSDRIKEVTMKFVQLPAGPTPLQTEPGGQSEQAPPSAVIRLSPDELLGFHYLTISVAPQPTLSGRPPPAASMAVGQFLNVLEGGSTISSAWILPTVFKQKEVVLRESHPLVSKLAIGGSLGMFSMSVITKTTSCGIRKPPEIERDHLNMCKLRCFPPIALAWDASSGLLALPSLSSETISVGSSAALWSRAGMERSSLVLVADPHCAYNVSMKISVTMTACRFLLANGLQISGFAVAMILFALMRQAYAWELDLPIPSTLSCLESNVLRPWSLTILCLGPLLVFLTVQILHNEEYPWIAGLVAVSFVCYAFASGAMVALALITSLILHSSASLHVFLKVRWHTRQLKRVRGIFCRLGGRLSLCSSLQKVQENRTFIGAVAVIVLVFFVHPALGLIVLSMTHGWCCHVALFRNRVTLQRNILKEGYPLQTVSALESSCSRVAAMNDSLENVNDDLSFSSIQLDLFNYRHGLLLLHLSATAMMTPSLVAWAQRPGWDRALPSTVDSVLCFGVIVHGLYGSGAKGNIGTFPVLLCNGSHVTEVRFSAAYLCAGFYCCIGGLTAVPYKAFHVLAALGLFTAICKFRERCGDQVGKRRHCRKHRQL